MKNPTNNTRRRGNADMKFKFNNKDKLNSSVDEMFRNSEIVALAYNSEINSPSKVTSKAGKLHQQQVSKLDELHHIIKTK